MHMMPARVRGTPVRMSFGLCHMRQQQKSKAKKRSYSRGWIPTNVKTAHAQDETVS
jgi:hypothetical protein